MKLRFLKYWRAYQPGQVTDVIGRGQGEVLIRRNFAEEVVDEPERTEARPPRASKDMKRKPVLNK